MASTRSIFDLPEFKPYHTRWVSRRNKFLIRRRYYDGTIYQDSRFRLAHKLYAATKALFLPLARAVDLDVALVPGVMGAWALSETATEAQISAQKQLYEWSRWAVDGDTWLEDGAKLGEAMIKIVPVFGAVRIKRMDPLSVMMAVAVDDTGQQMSMALIVDQDAQDAAGAKYEYAEVITPAEIRTYRDGYPHGYDGNPDRWPNPLGFVPVVGWRFDAEARPTFAKCQPQLDSVNELASYLADIIGRHAEPQWAVSGAEERELVKSGDNTWFLPNAGAKVEAILATIDVSGTLAFIEAIATEMKAGLPELAFDDLRSKDQIATETLKVQLIELVSKIWKVRRRADMALIEAHGMASVAALIMDIGGIEELGAPHEMDAQRPVLPQSRMEAIALEQAELGLELQRRAMSGDGLTATAAA